MNDNAIILTAWHNAEQKQKFCEAWMIEEDDPIIHFQQDKNKEGCATTKNKAIQWALDNGHDTVLVLDDDCYPYGEESGIPFRSLDTLLRWHVDCLRPQPVNRFLQVTTPPSRGTPYMGLSIDMPVAAAMSFWEHIGDYDACHQLVHGPTHPMVFKREVVYGSYFPLCGMALSFNARQWWPYCKFININRWDDIIQGIIWQRRAYELGYCFNLKAPLILHSRQSNVWKNLTDEVVFLEKYETFWKKVALSKTSDYDELCKLIHQ